MNSQADIAASVRGEKIPPEGRYDSMDHSDDDESSQTLLGGEWTGASKDRRRVWKIVLLFLSFGAILVFIGAMVYIMSTLRGIQQSIHLHPTGVELGDCGSHHTVEEARAKGCVFDAMSWLWVRPECYDQALIDDFMNRTEWSWHSDWKLTPESKIPLEEVFRGDHPQLYTAKKYHSIHCTYMWQKMHKALLEHRPVDSDLTSWHHTHHCEQVLLNEYLHEDSKCTADMICPTLVRATWTSCGYF